MQAPFDIAADLDTPVSAYLKLRDLKPRFLLESVEGGERLARYSFLGFGDVLEVRLDGQKLSIGDEALSRACRSQAVSSAYPAMTSRVCSNGCREKPLGKPVFRKRHSLRRHPRWCSTT
jgi:anthranilate/para-aminobenzoate synthase component I